MPTEYDAASPRRPLPSAAASDSATGGGPGGPDPDRWRAWLAVGGGSGGVEDGSGLAGVQLFANLNRARHFAGLTAFVQLGWFS